nr:hypothetical protein [Brevibacillus composti]
MRIVDAFLAIPNILFMLVILSVLGPSFPHEASRPRLLPRRPSAFWAWGFSPLPYPGAAC